MCCCRNRKVTFSAEQVADAAEMTKSRANAFLRQLFKEGRLAIDWEGRTNLTNRYHLIDDSPIVIKRRRLPRAKAKQRVWNSCRIMRNFTLNDIIVTAQVAESTARRYLYALKRCKLVRERKAEDGTVIYRLNYDCGQAAPEMIEDGVYAPSRECFYPYQEEL